MTTTSVLARPVAGDPFGAFIERRTMPGAPGGQLAGLRLAIKDMVNVAGRAPSLGLAIATDPIPSENAPVLERLLAAGATVVGFTRMTALAYEPSGSNPAQGRPLNPWDVERICGGSSSGSAVAVASDLVDAALGSDTAGSLRIPAHCCGVSAWKPSPAVVPDKGTMPLEPGFDTIGFLARDVATLARLARVFIAPSDDRSIERLAIATDLLDTAPGATAKAVEQLRRSVAEIGVATVDTRLRNLIHESDAAILTILQVGAAASHTWRITATALDPVLVRRLRKFEPIGSDAWKQAIEVLARMHTAPLDAAFAGCDAILLPVMPIETPLVSECEPDSPRFAPRTLYALSMWTRFVNAMHLPAVAIPGGVDANGMPIGLQLVGRRDSDAALLALAEFLQEAIDWHLRRPAGGTA